VSERESVCERERESAWECAYCVDISLLNMYVGQLSKSVNVHVGSVNMFVGEDRHQRRYSRGTSVMCVCMYVCVIV